MDMLVAYIMEFSIAAHSIIIGVNLGLLGEDDISSIVALMIALGFHQLVYSVYIVSIAVQLSYGFISLECIYVCTLRL